MQERFERRVPPPVEMAFMGDVQVIRNIKAKIDLLSNGDPEADEFRIVLIAPGGGQRGVVQGAVGIGLKRTGMVEAFDYFIGISSGAAMCYYTLAGEPEKGTEIYFKENVNNHFVDFRRLWKILDIDGLEQVVRVEKPISIQAIRQSRPAFYTVVTDKKTGEAIMLDVKQQRDPTTAVIASMCPPVLSGLLSGKTVRMHGNLYVDGGIGDPLPITFAIEHFGATDILVAMTQQPIPKKLIPLVQSAIEIIEKARIVPALFQKMATYDIRYNRELAYITGERELPHGVRIAAIYPSKMPITKFTMNRSLLESGASAAASFTEHLFSSVS